MNKKNLSRQEAFELEAQEFYFGPRDDFSTMENGRVVYETKEKLKNELQARVSRNEFDSVMKTRHNSYTFIPKPRKNGDELIPVRVFLAKEDTIGEYNNSEFFNNLIISNRALKKSKAVNKLVLAVGVTAVLVAGNFALAGPVSDMLQKDAEYEHQKIAPYIEQQEQLRKQEELEKLFREDQKKEAEEQKKMMPSVESVSESSVSRGSIK